MPTVTVPGNGACQPGTFLPEPGMTTFYWLINVPTNQIPWTFTGLDFFGLGQLRYKYLILYLQSTRFCLCINYYRSALIIETSRSDTRQHRSYYRTSQTTIKADVTKAAAIL
jgi:hypothetical protein